MSTYSRRRLKLRSASSLREYEWHNAANTLVSVSWFRLHARRQALPRIYYADLRAADPSIQLIYSFEDVETHEDAFVDFMDSMVSEMQSFDSLVQLGYWLIRNGFSRSLVEQFTEILLASLKTLYGQDWTSGIEEAWIDVLGKASFIIQGADQRRFSV